MIKQQLIRSEVKALKSQMNPHFIFNALNSIQDLILKNDMRQTNKYLVKISRLIREVLKTSDKESITLEEELDMLGLYTDLEKLRFGEDLSIPYYCRIRRLSKRNDTVTALNYTALCRKCV